MFGHHLTEIYFGNTLQKWLLCGGIILLTLLLNGWIARLASKISYRIFKKVSQAQFYEEFSRLLNRPFINLINLLAVYLAFSQITFPAEWELAKIDEFGIRFLLH